MWKSAPNGKKVRPAMIKLKIVCIFYMKIIANKQKTEEIDYMSCNWVERM